MPCAAPHWLLAGLLLAGATLPASGAARDPRSTSSARKPNIILIMADDLGYGELGCYGQRFIQTPNIDRLAAEGMRFTQFYCGAPVCAPSRCVLMTGKHTGHAYIRNNGNPKHLQHLRDKYGWEFPGQFPIPDSEVTIGELLQGQGYATAAIGKWGLGHFGTTGDPKGVMLTHGNFLSNVEATLRGVDLYPTDRTLSFLPLSHVLERTAGYYGPMAAGAAIYFAESMETIPENLVEVKPTFAVSVPRLFEKMHARIMEKVNAAPPAKQKLFNWARSVGARAYDKHHPEHDSLSVKLQLIPAKKLVHEKLAGRFGGNIRFFVSGGAPLNKNICRFFQSLGIKILEGYGLTETSPIITLNPTNTEQRKIGSVGMPFLNTDIKILDLETGLQELPQGEDGEIAASGPQIMLGYWNKPGANEEVFRQIDGERYFLTGDIGHFDEDGFIIITDRKKDLIIVGGFNAYPKEIEEELYAHPKVALVAVVGVPDPRSGEAVKAFVQLKPGEKATEEELMEFCKDKLAGYKRPREIEFREIGRAHV